MTIFQTQEAAANFSIPFRLPLFLRVVASNGSTSFIFVLLFEEKGGGGETRDEVNSKRQYTVRFIFETLDDDLSILSYEKRCEPRECAPTEEEVRPENGNSRLSIANESGDQSHPRDSFPDCSPIVSRSFLSDLKVFPLFFFFFHFSLFFFLRVYDENVKNCPVVKRCGPVSIMRFYGFAYGGGVRSMVA